MRAVAIYSPDNPLAQANFAYKYARSVKKVGLNPCLIDLDFYTPGLAGLFRIGSTPQRGIEHFFLAADPQSYDLSATITSISAPEERGLRKLPALLNRWALNWEKSSPNVEDFIFSLIGDEPNFREFSIRIPILIERLSTYHPIIINCCVTLLRAVAKVDGIDFVVLRSERLSWRRLDRYMQSHGIATHTHATEENNENLA